MSRFGAADAKMSQAPSVAYIDEHLVPFSQAGVPLEDRGLQFGESIYEVIAVTAGQPRLLVEHAERMRAGAAFIGIDAGVPDVPTWQRMFGELYARDPITEGILYAQVTGGAAPRAHVVTTRPAPTFFAYLRETRFPRADAIAQGIRVITLEDIRWARRDVKTTMLLPAVLARREAVRRSASEALFIAEGRVNEGAATNVFAVEGRTIVTPAQTTNLLPGITRPLVGRLAQAAGLSMHAQPLELDRLLGADEVFVTSTTYTVMPVTHVDDRPIGSGKAGAIATDLARRLRQAFELE